MRSSVHTRRAPQVILVGAMVLFSGTAMACGDAGLAPHDSVSLDVTPGQAELNAVGDTVRFSVLHRGTEGSPAPVTPIVWRSTVPSVAEVDDEGLALARGVGVTIIVAEAEGVAGTAVLSVQADTLPPQVSSVDAHPRTVRVLNRAGVVILTAELTDHGTGVAQAAAQFSGPGGATISSLVTMNLVEGTAKEGRFQGFLTVPANADPGVWNMAVLFVEDASGNSRVWGPEDLKRDGLDLALNVVWAR